jgi:hypothetical protein
VTSAGATVYDEAGTREGTGWFVYGIVPVDARLPAGITGLDDAPVSTVEHGRVAALVGPILLDRQPRLRTDLLRYAQVLDAVAVTAPVAPVRFSAVMADRRHVVEEILAPQQEWLADLLAALDGRVQYRLRAHYVEDVVLTEVVASDPRVRELRERTRDLPEDASYGDRVRLGELVAHGVEERRRGDAGDLLDAALPFAVDHRVAPPARPTDVLEVSLLVENDRREALETALEALAEAVHQRIRLSLMGPTAAYEFVEEV